MKVHENLHHKNANTQKAKKNQSDIVPLDLPLRAVPSPTLPCCSHRPMDLIFSYLSISSLFKFKLTPHCTLKSVSHIPHSILENYAQPGQGSWHSLLPRGFISSLPPSSPRKPHPCCFLGTYFCLCSPQSCN